MYFPSNSSLLKSLSFVKSNFSCFFTSTLSFPLNFIIIFLAFSKSSFFFHMLFTAVNLFQCTKYFTTSLIFLLFKKFYTSHSLSLPVLLLLLSSPPLALYILLLDKHSQPDESSLKSAIVV